MKKNTPLVRAAHGSHQLFTHMHRWKFSVLAAAAVVSTGFYAEDASALALGRIAVQSALGEPLRAEIDLPQITPAEADTLRATTATPDVFRAQGMEYTQTMTNLQIKLQRRADGTAVLRLSSDRPVNEPFLDLVLDANWGSGRIVRSYTMLFDPPALRRPAPTVTTAPQIAPAQTQQASQTPLPPPVARAPVAPRAIESAPARPAAPAPRATPAAPAAPANGVPVQAGDTASRLANAYRPASVSLDQMLVAMMRANPDAFIQGNVNRLKAGSVLQMPDEAAAQATPAAQARQILTAQARDFNEFRRTLADNAPATQVAAAQRSVTGTVQTQVDDKKPATAAPDKLTLSKGSVSGQKTAEDEVAQAKQASETAARMAELSKNITELNKLGATSAPAGGAATTAAGTASNPAAGGINLPAVSTAPAVAAAADPAAPAAVASAAASDAAAATAQAADSAPAQAPASAPATVATPAAAPIPVPVSAPAADPGFFSDLMDEPLLPLGAGILLAALLIFGAYRVRQRRAENAGVDSSFLESRIQPDSFFGASGGQRVDTANSEMTTGSSMAYSPSQLDAGGDVDPVAEADVYLAYGRDLQAEEILKEAIRHNPARTSVHVKLGEIYAKRQDRKALEVVAGDVFKLTQGEGADWARITDLGRDLDPTNRLYQSGGRPGLGEDDYPSVPPSSFPSMFAAAGVNASTATSPPDLDFDLDLDLDLDLPEGALTEVPGAPLSEFPGQLDLPSITAPAFNAQGMPPDAMAAPAPQTAPQPAPTVDLDFPRVDDLTMAPSGPMPLASDAPPSTPMEFDLGDLSLDLSAPFKPMVAPAAKAMASVPAPADDGSVAAQNDPLATKLALAAEFQAIGDIDGARTLMEEVVAESSGGALKTRAQRMLADLG